MKTRKYMRKRKSKKKCLLGIVFLFVSFIHLSNIGGYLRVFFVRLDKFFGNLQSGRKNEIFSKVNKSSVFWREGELKGKYIDLVLFFYIL